CSTRRLSPTTTTILSLRDALPICRDLGYATEEGQISVDEWQAGCAAGTLTEGFACGTAAVITPVGTVKSAVPQANTAVRVPAARSEAQKCEITSPYDLVFRHLLVK